MATSKSKFQPEHTIVKVLWADAWYNDRDHPDMMEPLPLTLVGHVVNHSPKGIKLAMERSSSYPRHRHICFVPSFNIVKLTVLQKA